MIKSENFIEDGEQICLMFSPETMAKACQEYDRYSNNSAGWNAYRNRLCLETFVSWLGEFEVYSQLQQPKAWPDETELPSFWELVEGAAIQWGETRLVLIPMEAEELETFSVPRDWVDIWPADYYVAIQVSLDEDEEDNWMQVWGYTTHRELKRKGQYHKRDRAYCLDGEELIPDITMMLFARQLVSNRKAGVQAVPALDRSQAVGLLERLSKPDVYYPRLAVPFEEWGGLMVNPAWRQQLYEQRLAQVQDKVPAAVATSKSPVQLRKWFDDIVEAGWRTIEEIIEALGTGSQELNLAYGFAGSADRFRDLATDDRFRDVAVAALSGNTFQEAVPMLINLLESSKDKLTRLQATDLLGRIAEGSQEAIAALTKLAKTDRDSDMRRQAAVTLKKIDPKNVQAGVRYGRLIDFGMQLGEIQVALVLTLMPELNQKTNVHLRVYPLKGEKTLPSNLQLLVLSDKSDTLLSTESGSADNAVQLELRGDMGDFFTVKVALGNASITEYFVL